jgi:predicted component of type VI protein secretion system
MPSVTFQVLEGVDKGRVFREIGTPVTIGREEGNVVRLNDERVSRFHAKIQCDNSEIILTDLESTNGTRVNGNVVQIRRLRPGDRVGLGRTLLLFGSEDEINARMTALGSVATSHADPQTNLIAPQGPATVHAASLAVQFDHDADFNLNAKENVTVADGALFLGKRPLPPLPQKMTPSQAARLAELLDFLHRHLTTATENINANEDASQVSLGFAEWQRVLGVQMLLARYVRAIAEPDTLED